jgi:hypothetical protein
MIDFRYHLVSLVSVFLALAVGIVLGAGPLKGEIGDQLNRSVHNLAADNADLRTQVATLQGAVANRDTFTRTVLPLLAAGQLTGQRVVLVTLPGVDADAVTALGDALKDAGATVSGHVGVEQGWVDPDRAADRDGVVARLAGAASSSSAVAGAAVAGAAVAGASRTGTTLATLLAGALLSRDAEALGRTDAAQTRLLGALDKAGLITLDGDLKGRAGEAVLLVPAVQAAADQAPSPSPSVPVVPQWSALAAALDGVGDGCVVTGPASSATSGGVVAAIRGDDTLTATISTVDTGGTPMGDLTTVLALHEQEFGVSGRYGFVGKVDAPLPRPVT